MKKVALLVAVLFCLGAAFTVQSASKPTGKLKVATPGVALELKIDEKPIAIPNGREIPLPVGAYTPATITCYSKQAEGSRVDMWSIKSAGPFGELKEISVADGELASVEAGPPFLLKAVVGQSASGGGKVVSIGIAITGKAGEVYSPATIRKGQNVVPPPQLQIVTENGTVLAQGKFEYG